ncbi:hypothetical protein [Ornithobacterium rhinotracheale]|uniref:hypothetical protein n=1 Tax=Ornithobacterium rhinotracheale TaxID=28251 RepID=UPI001FF19EA7|nr:hypothetical protein [Ornithobacterium rhinotracheale]MCK0204541.1 hypothetical protein [Ornithobacterium rhinotracheale]
MILFKKRQPATNEAPAYIVVILKARGVSSPRYIRKNNPPTAAINKNSLLICFFSLLILCLLHVEHMGIVYLSEHSTHKPFPQSTQVATAEFKG